MIASSSGGASQTVDIRLRVQPDPGNEAAFNGIQGQVQKLRAELAKGFSLASGVGNGGIAADIKRQADAGLNGVRDAVKRNGKAAGTDWSKAMTEGMSKFGGAPDKLIAGLNEFTRRAKVEYDKQAADARRASDQQITEAKRATASRAANMTKLMGQSGSTDSANSRASDKMIFGMGSGARAERDAAAKASAAMKSEWARLAESSVAENRKMWEKRIADAKKGAEREAVIANEVNENWNRMAQMASVNDAKAQSQRAANVKKTAAAQQVAGRQAEMASMRQQMIVNRSEQGLVRLGMAGGGAARALMMLSQGNEPLEKMATNVLQIQAGFDLLRSGADVFILINRELLNMRRYSYYAATEQKALAASTAAVGAARMGGAASGAAGAMPGLAGLGIGSMLGGAAAGATSVSPVTAALGITIAPALIQEAIARLVFNTEGTSSALVGWWNATRDAEKSTRQLAALEAAQEDRKTVLAERAGKFQQSADARGRLIEGQAELARAGGQRFGIRSSEMHARDLMLQSFQTVSGQRLTHGDTLGLKSLPATNGNIAEREFYAKAIREEQGRLAAVQASDAKANARPSYVSEIPSPKSIWGPFGVPEGIFDKMFGAQETNAQGKPLTNPGSVVGMGGPDLAEQITHMDQLSKLQKDAASVAEKDLRAQEQKRDVLAQILASGNQLIQQARDQAKAAREEVTARQAHLGILTKGEQAAVAKSLKKIRTGGASREDYMIAQHYGATTGALGRKVNAGIAKNLDPELSKEFEAGGGNEDLQQALGGEKDAVEAVAKANTEMAQTLGDVRDAYDAWMKRLKEEKGTEHALEQAKATQGGYKLDDSGAAGNSAGLNKSNAELKETLRQFIDAVAQGQRELKTLLQVGMQRMKQAH
jgi:hypothetical protein